MPTSARPGTVALSVAPPARDRQLMVQAAVAFGLPLAVAAAGAAATIDAIPGWYRGLRKPAWNPPDRVFGPAWTLLYLLMGAAMLLVWRSDADPRRIRRATGLWLVQLALNLAWSLIFFGRRRIGAGLAEVLLLWVAVAATLVAFGRTRPAAGGLLVPYLAWTTFATALNAEILRRNG